VLVLRPIDLGQARYYLDGPAPGRWVGAGSEDLELRGQVDERSLHAVLAGHRPSGDKLLERIPAARRSGFDLILAAPKSVSLVAALGDDQHRILFHQSHEQAVQSVIGYLERDAVRTRRGNTRQATTGLVAATFRHCTSAAHDPHLHSHLVVANLVHAEDGRWSTLDSRSLYRHGRAAGAVYQATLRHHLAQHGLGFDWTVNRHGLGDIAGVPRAAIEASSIRGRQVVQEIEATLAGRVGRATAAGRTRHSVDGALESKETWRRRVAAAGLDRTTVDRLLVDAATRSHLVSQIRSGPDPVELARLLSEQHSRFRRPDVVRAAAIVSVRGLSASGLEAAADSFLRSAVPAGDDSWTTPGLKRLEERIVSAAGPPVRSSAGLVAADTPPPPDMSESGREAVTRLTREGAPVDLMRGELISQAQVLDAARGAWEASGHCVALVSPTERGQARWQTLAGLERPPPPPAHPTVVVVDNAERWSTADLHRVMADASARQAKVVLLDGGSQPRRRRAESPAMDDLRAKLVTIDAGSAPALSRDPDQGRATATVVPAGREGTVVLAPTARGAMAGLVEEWQRLQAAGERPRLVALGPEEAEHLNAMARALRVESGQVRGPSVDIGGRLFQAGDEVQALRRDRRLGGVPGGALGRVTAVDAEHHQATIEWQGRDSAVTVGGSATSAPSQRHPDDSMPKPRSRSTSTSRSKGPLPLTHGYATTPPYLRHGHDGPLLGLGHIEAVAPSLAPERIYDIAPAPAADVTRDRSNPVASLLVEASGRDDGSHNRRRTAADLAADASRSLEDLAGERDRLAEYLRANVPPDVRTELRRACEDRTWLVGVAARPVDGRSGRYGSPAVAPNLAAHDDRLEALTAAARSRTDWLEQHRGQLGRWADLTHAIAWREAALGRGAELRPTVAVLAQLGPVPGDTNGRRVWRRGAEAVEAHRERWSLPDRPLELGKPATDLDPSRRAGELRVLAAAQEVQRTRGLDRDRGRDCALTPPRR
jgi:conjugative relaxase-like TrwC/TraI family protein